MSDNEKKPMSVGHSLSSSAGIGTLLTCVVSVYDSNLTAKLAPVIPIVGSGLTFIGAWLWNRYGCETPELAAIRNKLERDAKNLKKLIKNNEIDDLVRNKAKEEYGQTMFELATLGRANIVVPIASTGNTSSETQATD